MASPTVTRAWVFFFANLASGWRAALGAMIAEFLLRAVTSGFYGALTQHFRRVRPAWTGAVAVMVLLPVTSHSLELLVHWMRHTPRLFTSIVSSICELPSGPTTIAPRRMAYQLKSVEIAVKPFLFLFTRYTSDCKTPSVSSRT
jgi:hypothetical protein